MSNKKSARITAIHVNQQSRPVLTGVMAGFQPSTGNIAEPPRPSEVWPAIQRQSEAMERLKDAVEAVVNELRDVTSNGTVAAGSPESPSQMAPTCEIATRIEGANFGIDELTNRLQWLRSAIRI